MNRYVSWISLSDRKGGARKCLLQKRGAEGVGVQPSAAQMSSIQWDAKGLGRLGRQTLPPRLGSSLWYCQPHSARPLQGTWGSLRSLLYQADANLKVLFL